MTAAASTSLPASSTSASRSASRASGTRRASAPPAPPPRPAASPPSSPARHAARHRHPRDAGVPPAPRRRTRARSTCCRWPPSPRAATGREMTEIGFLMDAGAVAFMDGRAVADARVFQRCLTYAAGLGALVLGHPQERALTDGHLRHRGPVRLAARPSRASRRSPSASGSSATSRSSRRRACATTPTSSPPPPRSPALSRARAAGLAVTAGASIHHLTLNEFDIGDYRTFFKLRAAAALRGRPDGHWSRRWPTGSIDVIGSFHTPQDEEEKRLPFEEAAPGAVGLETLLPAAMQLYHAGHLTLPALWRALAAQPGAAARPRRRPPRARGAGRSRALRSRRCPSSSTAPRCARSRRTRPTTSAACRAACSPPGSAAREVYGREPHDPRPSS